MGGARGGGKTDTGFAWILYDIDKPYLRVLVIRKNNVDLSDWIDRARQFYSKVVPGFRFKGNPPVGVFPDPNNPGKDGATITTGHLKDENAYEKYMGHEYQRIIIEELTHIPREADYIKLLGSCRSKYPDLPAQILTTFNPGGAGHAWVKARFVDVCKNKVFTYTLEMPNGKVVSRSRIFIPATIYDNPFLIENDPGYLVYLHNIPDKKLRQAWLEGDWEIFSGQYFNTFSPHIHVIKPFEIPAHWKISAGMDYGNTTCAEVVATNPDTMERYVIAEWTELNKTRTYKADSYRNFIEELGYKELRDKTIGDSNMMNLQKELDEKKTPADIFRDREIFIRPVIKKSPDNRRFRIWCNDYIKDLLFWKQDDNGFFIKKPKLFLFEDRCPELIKTFPELQVNKKFPEDLEKKEDHHYDALKYCLISEKKPRNLENERRILQRHYLRS